MTSKIRDSVQIFSQRFVAAAASDCVFIFFVFLVVQSIRFKKSLKTLPYNNKNKIERKILIDLMIKFLL